MADVANQISPIDIEVELKQSYLDYAMSVIIGRALPDVRDGLKPVHRRSLFAMHQLNNDWNKPYKKSARVVGDVIGKYHPHGDFAVYYTLVRMAQPFSLRYMLVDGQGNFGSVDGDPPAAMRYTEIRMTKVSHSLLADLEKETVDFVENYDGTELIPEVLPTRVPNLLVNGSAGIAVGMATNIPPHNLGEVVDACLALIDKSEISIDELMEYLPGPDFPTGAIINGKAGIIEAYRTGRGRIYLRAKHHFETLGNREAIIFTEIPYQLNKAKLIERIAELVKEKKIEGIAELRDESDKDGMRIVVEVKRGESPEVLVNNLFTQTALQGVFGINMVALDKGQPQLLNLKQILEAFVRHRQEVVTRRTVFELRKAKERGHLLEGLAIALSNIDEVIELIRSAASPAEAREGLLAQAWKTGQVVEMLAKAGADACKPDDLAAGLGMAEDASQYLLSPEQAQAILDLRLHRLTGMEHEKLLVEYQAILERIAEFSAILADSNLLMQLIKDELLAIKEEYNDERRSEIIASRQDFSIEDLIAEEDRVVTLSRTGYIKAQPLADYRAQRRGGRGKSATSMKDEDVIEQLLVASTHTNLLLFSTRGKVYWLKVYELPTGSRGSRGRPLVNLLPLEDDEQITTLLTVDEYSSEQYIFMATQKGTVKKTSLDNFSRPRSNGLIALDLVEGDQLVGAAITHGDDQVMLLTSTGKAIRFEETHVRGMGRQAKGVIGIRMPDGGQVISLIIPRSKVVDAVEDEEEILDEAVATETATDAETSAEATGEIYILTASENGYGKRTRLAGFPLRGRGGQGVIAMQCSERNGALVSAIQVEDGEEMMLITNKGTLVRTRVDEVSITSRNTQGVTLIRLSDEEEQLTSVVRVDELEKDDDELEDELNEAESADAETATDEVSNSDNSSDEE